MDRDTVEALNALNRRFYRERAQEFSRTRERAWRGWDLLMSRVADALPPRPRVLDVGCGNGRFARFLRGTLAGGFDYLGIDASALAIEFARERLRDYPNVRLREHDFILAAEPLPSELAGERFDLVVLFGVLHHVPGAETRARLLEGLATLLAPAGLLAFSVWRFDRFERFRNKLIPWSSLGDTVRESELEPGDHLLTWAGEGPPHRYCHAASDREVDDWIGALELDRRESFLGDGELNRYIVLRKP